MKIQQAICLCVDKRQHYFQDIKKQFKNIDIPLKLFIAGNGQILPTNQYDHIDINDVASSWSYASGQARINEYNVFLCHKKMLQYAKDNKLDNVLLMEDDVIILPRFNKLIPQVLEQLTQVSWGACYLGYHHPTKEQTETQYQQDKKVKIISVSDIGGFHGTLIHNSAYDTLLNIPPTHNMDSLCCKHVSSYFSIPRLIFYQNTNSVALEESSDVKFNNYEEHLLKAV